MVLVPDEQQLTIMAGDALRARNSQEASLLRMLKHSLHNAAIAQGGPLDEQARISLYRKEIKQRQEAAELFKQGGRLDSAEQEQGEAAFILGFLPQLATRQQISEVAASALTLLKDQSPSPKGLLIKQVREKFGSNADGKMIAEVVNELLR